MNHIRGLVYKSEPEALFVKLETGVILRCNPRRDLGYMDPVFVAYDFTTNRVRDILTPQEVPSSEDCPVEDKPKFQRIDISDYLENIRFLEEEAKMEPQKPWGER